MITPCDETTKAHPLADTHFWSPRDPKGENNSSTSKLSDREGPSFTRQYSSIETDSRTNNKDRFIAKTIPAD